MNNLIALVLAFAFTTPLLASGIIFPSSVEDKSITVLFQDQDDSSVSVKIQNNEGETLYNKEFSAAFGSGKVFNLAHLPNGEYKMTIEGSQQIVEKTIALDDAFAQIVKDEVIYRPTMIQKENEIHFNHLALNEDVSVIIRDEQGNDLYSERFSGENNIKRIYNFDESNAGRIELIVFYANHLSSKQFDL